MKKRVITAIGYVIVILGLLILKWLLPDYGLIGLDLLFWAISIIGAYEFLRAVKVSRKQWWTTMITCALIIPAFVVTKMVSEALERPAAVDSLIAFMAVVSVGAMITVSLLVFDFDGGAVQGEDTVQQFNCVLLKHSSLNSTALSVLCIVYCGVLSGVCANMNHLEINSLPAVLLMFFITASTDTFAFFTGKLLGKKFPRKLAPHTSPNKTVVGSIGGLIGGVFAATMVWIICEYVPDIHFIFTGRLHKYVLLILISMLAALFSQLGDLFESAIKRSCGVKDMGNILPGHGGILDRFDSTLFAAVPIVVCFMVIR